MVVSAEATAEAMEEARAVVMVVVTAVVRAVVRSEGAMEVGWEEEARAAGAGATAKVAMVAMEDMVTAPWS